MFESQEDWYCVIRLVKGEVLGLNGGLAEADTRGRTITLTVEKFLFKTAGPKVSLGGNIGVLTGNGG